MSIIRQIFTYEFLFATYYQHPMLHVSYVYLLYMCFIVYVSDMQEFM